MNLEKLLYMFEKKIILSNNGNSLLIKISKLLSKRSEKYVPQKSSYFPIKSRGIKQELITSLTVFRCWIITS